MPKLPMIDLSQECYKKSMPYAEFAKIPPTPFQRNHTLRIKLKKVVESLSKLKVEHLEVAIAELTEDSYDDDGNFYRKGDRFISNGNTRLYYWENGLSDYSPKTVNATIYLKKNMDEIREHYNTFDSPNAVEVNAEKVAGIIKGVHGYHATSDKVKKGQLLTSLCLASHYLQPNIYDSDRMASNIKHAPSFVSLYIEEIKAFDKVCRNSKNWDAPLICAALMCFKKYGVKHKKVIDCLNKIDMAYVERVTNTGPFDGVSNISHEWWTAHKVFRDRVTSWSKPEGKGNIGMKWTVSYALYWIEKFLENEKGVKAGSNWEQTGKNFFHTMNTTQMLDQFLCSANSTKIKEEDDDNVIPMKVSNG